MKTRALVVLTFALGCGSAEPPPAPAPPPTPVQVAPLHGDALIDDLSARLRGLGPFAVSYLALREDGQAVARLRLTVDLSRPLVLVAQELGRGGVVQTELQLHDRTGSTSWTRGAPAGTRRWWDLGALGDTLAAAAAELSPSDPAPTYGLLLRLTTPPAGRRPSVETGLFVGAPADAASWLEVARGARVGRDDGALVVELAADAATLRLDPGLGALRRWQVRREDGAAFSLVMEQPPRRLSADELASAFAQATPPAVLEEREVSTRVLMEAAELLATRLLLERLPRADASRTGGLLPFAVALTAGLERQALRALVRSRVRERLAAGADPATVTAAELSASLRDERAALEDTLTALVIRLHDVARAEASSAGVADVVDQELDPVRVAAERRREPVDIAALLRLELAR